MRNRRPSVVADDVAQGQPEDVVLPRHQGLRRTHRWRKRQATARGWTPCQASPGRDVALVVGADKVRESPAQSTFWDWAQMTRDMAWDYPHRAGPQYRWPDRRVGGYRAVQSEGLACATR